MTGIDLMFILVGFALGAAVTAFYMSPAEEPEAFQTGPRETDPWFKGEYGTAAASHLASDYLRLFNNRFDPDRTPGASPGIARLLGWDAPMLKEIRNMLASKGWFIRTWQGQMVMCHPSRNKILRCFDDPYQMSSSVGWAGLMMEYRPDSNGKTRPGEKFMVSSRGAIGRGLENV